MINLSQNFIGNNKIIDKLIYSYSENILSNSIIFSGPKGLGKTTAAFFLIKKIYQNIDFKNNNLNLIHTNSHPNIRYIDKQIDEKTNKSKNSISIEQIRRLKDFINQSSFDDLPKFIIIDSANDLNNNSANSLLKSLEEPKKNTYYILIAHQISNLLPTIKSRCFNYLFEKPSYEEFNAILNKSENKINLSDINFLYIFSNASPGLALEIFSENMVNIFSDIIQIFIDNEALSSNVINLANKVSAYAHEEFKNFILLIKFIIQSIIKINYGFSFDNSLKSNSLEYLTNKANYISKSNSFKILEFINENENDLYIYNLDKKIFFFNIFATLGN